MRVGVVLVLLVDVMWDRVCFGYSPYQLDYRGDDIDDDEDFYDTYDIVVVTTPLLTTTRTESDVLARYRRFGQYGFRSGYTEEDDDDSAPTLLSIPEFVLTRSHKYNDNDKLRSLNPEEIEDIKDALRDIMKGRISDLGTTPTLYEDRSGYENFIDVSDEVASTFTLIETSKIFDGIHERIRWEPAEKEGKGQIRHFENGRVKEVEFRRQEDDGPSFTTPTGTDYSNWNKYFTTTSPVSKAQPTPADRKPTTTTESSSQSQANLATGGGLNYLKTTTPNLNPTSPKLNFTTPNLNLTTPKLNLTTPKLNFTTPKLNLTTPKLNITTPKLNFTTPKLNFTTPKLNFTTPKLNFTTPKLNFTTPKWPPNFFGPNITTSKKPKTPKSPVMDINAIIAIIANLTYDYEWNLTEQFNKTLIQHGVPTCPTASTVTTTTTTPSPYDFSNSSVVSKCFVCGLKTPEIPIRAYCADAFAGDFLPLTPVEPLARGQIANFRKYCRFLDVHNYVENPSEPRSIYGRFTGGCGVRWTDLTGVYTQRTCRNRYKPLMGKHFASKRMAKLELALINIENGCIISPMASLLPLSRGISLYARFHACVCTGNWCNKAIRLNRWKMYWTMLLHWYFNRIISQTAKGGFFNCSVL